jgi:hypothetical protein
MAVTYGSNLGSNSLGAFAIIPVTAGAAADTFGVLQVVAGEIAAADVPLTALQLAALNSTYAKLNSGTVDALGVLSALVGVVSLDSANTVSLSMVGDVLTATCSAAGKVAVFVPNSAASGIVVGGSGGGGAVPTTQRYDAVANVPGLPLAGVACLSAPNPAGTNSKTIVFATPLLTGYASTAATAQTDFNVEKIDMSLPDPGVGAGTPMFTLRFAAGAQQPTVVVPPGGGFTVLPGWMYRIVNPNPADATLADIAITLVGYLPL